MVIFYSYVSLPEGNIPMTALHMLGSMMVHLFVERPWDDHQGFNGAHSLTSVQYGPWYLAHPQSEQNTQSMQKNMIWILDKWMDHGKNHHAFPYLIIATEAQPQQSHDGMFTDAHSDGVSDGWAGPTIAIMVWLPCLTHPLPNIWVNFITTSRRDRTLESWFISGKSSPNGPTIQVTDIL